MEVLKEIALEGFKSFRDKTVFKFDGLLTGVVGPNGSGKSNVVDAIKWILGDPSPRSIRAQTGLEAIYRPANGNGDSAGFASVAIKIDNTETEIEGEPTEWEIERRYYKSGESVYTLNGKTARLKDIRAIMARKGFGLGSLSVVGQGEIDGFLSLVPGDRRLVFEDLARISDFKANKRKILSQLEETARNQERLRDLIGEMLVRVDNLAVQAEAAKKHAELTDAKTEAEAQSAAQEYLLAQRNYARNESRLEELKKELEDIKKALEKASVDLRQAKIELENARTENSETLRESEKGRRELDHAVAEERRLTDANKHLSTLIGTLENELNERDGRIEELKKRQSEHENIALTSGDEFRDNARLRLDLDNYLSRKWGQMRCYERERERLAGRVERLQGEGSLFARDAEFHNRRAEAFDKEFRELTGKKGQLENDKSGFEIKRTGLHDELELLKTAKSERKEAIGVAVQKIHDEEGELSKATGRQRETESEIKALENEFKILKELEASREGYGEGTRAILGKRAKFPGLRGTLGELINVDTGYERIFEKVLGESIEYLVTDTMDHALEIIAETRSGQFGSVACIVLEMVRDTAKDYGQSDLINFVKIDDDLKPVLAILLSGASKVENAGQFRDSGLNKVLVTSDGLIFRPPAIIAGGSEGSPASGILTRRARIQEIGHEIHKLKYLDAEIKAGIGNLHGTIDTLKANLKELESELADIEDRIRAAIFNGEQLNLKIEQIEVDLFEIDERLAEIRRDRDGCVESARLASHGIEAVRRARIDSENSLEAVENKIPFLQTMVEDLRSRLQRAIVLEARYREESERASKEARRIDGEIKNIIDQTGAKKRHLDEVRHQALGTSDELDNAIKLRNELEVKLPELERRENEAKEKIDKLVELVSEAELNLDVSREAVDNAENAVHNQEIRLAELKGGLQALETGLDEFPEFAGRIRSGEMSGKDIPSKKELMEKLQILNEELEALGSVNPLAIEEEKHARARVDELQRERDDLILAEVELRKALEEVEEKSEKAFVSTFNVAKEKFAATFGALFPGGSGELGLTEPENPLDSGIDVRVRFPGKGELDLLQFSGGERSLIALALLFAILKVKPSSFTVLDEVEAALDDVNTQKFLDYLGKEFSDRQFILITHNKITMERADRLYGVTMRGGGGVSQVVSVDFKNLKQDEVDELIGAAS
ncbi:MAG: chromosome segregation protein SMC [bacterium]|nr:chromosome segregation protein SMC [bacterium]